MRLNITDLSLCLECVRNQYKVFIYNNPKDVKQRMKFSDLIGKLEGEIGISEFK